MSWLATAVVFDFIFIALLFFIYGIIDMIFTKRPTLASLDYDRISRDINFLEKEEIINAPISTKWYYRNGGYSYSFHRREASHPNCPDKIQACMCLLGGDEVECKSFKNIDFRRTQPMINLNMDSKNAKYYIEIEKRDCDDKICFVDLTLK